MSCTKSDLDALASYGVIDPSTMRVNLSSVEMYCKMFASVVSNCPLCTDGVNTGLSSTGDLRTVGESLVKIIISRATSASEGCVESIVAPIAWSRCLEAVKEVLGVT